MRLSASGRLSPAKSELLNMSALAGEVGTAEYEHRVVALRNLLGPPAELVGLALAGFAQQREQGLAARGEGFEQGGEVPALHEKLAVVFLLPVDPAQEA